VHAGATRTCEELGALVVGRPRARIAVTIFAVATTILLGPVIVRKTRSKVLASSNSAVRSVVVVDAVRACPTIPAHKRDTTSIVPELTRTASSSLAVGAGHAVKRAFSMYEDSCRYTHILSPEAA
jgi:hypothetical protein